MLHSLLFCAALVLPAIGMLLGVNDDEILAENRTLAPVPRWPRTARDWNALPGHTQSWFDDNFGFRSHLIGSERKAAWYGARKNISLTIGREGWLFLYSASELNAFRCMRFDAARRRAWTELARERSRRLREHGALFVWVIAPNKHSVYAEYFPDDVKPGECQIEAPISEIPEGMELIDLREALIREKGAIHTYHKTDSHWNQLGALVGAREILRRLRPRFHALSVPSLEAYEIRVRARVPGGDDARIFRIYGEDYREDLVVVTPRDPVHARPVEGSPPLDPFVNKRRERVLKLETGNESLPTAVVFHDSFMHAMMPVLAEQFRRVVFAHTDGAIDEQLVALERPDIVVSLMLESRLGMELPRDRWLGAETAP
jgi:hypothetical protein